MAAMPTNVTPEFRKLQDQYRRARDPKERLELLSELLRVLPKHKGTEHLRAELRTKQKELIEQLTGPPKGAARTGPQVAFHREGAAQIALIGPPNSGKSAVHARLTGSHSISEPYPFATRHPIPGMFPHAGIAFQLIDVPSLAPGHPVPYITNTLHNADGALLIVDLSEPGVLERTEATLGLLADRKIDLVADWSGQPVVFDDAEDLFRLRLPTLLVANKADQITDPAAELEALEELLGVDFPTMAVSADTGAGLDQLGSWLFHQLGVVRVHTKVPGQDPDLDHPFALREGDTVLDLARLIHRDVARDFRFARVWGSTTFDGQQVGRDHLLVDGDVVEIHT